MDASMESPRPSLEACSSLPGSTPRQTLEACAVSSLPNNTPRHSLGASSANSAFSVESECTIRSVGPSEATSVGERLSAKVNKRIRGDAKLAFGLPATGSVRTDMQQQFDEKVVQLQVEELLRTDPCIENLAVALQNAPDFDEAFDAMIAITSRKDLELAKAIYNNKDNFVRLVKSKASGAAESPVQVLLGALHAGSSLLATDTKKAVEQVGASLAAVMPRMHLALQALDSRQDSFEQQLKRQRFASP